MWCSCLFHWYGSCKLCKVTGYCQDKYALIFCSQKWIENFTGCNFPGIPTVRTTLSIADVRWEVCVVCTNCIAKRIREHPKTYVACSPVLVTCHESFSRQGVVPIWDCVRCTSQRFANLTISQLVYCHLWMPFDTVEQLHYKSMKDRFQSSFVSSDNMDLSLVHPVMLLCLTSLPARVYLRTPLPAQICSSA